jgi:hypothetical protein
MLIVVRGVTGIPIPSRTTPSPIVPSPVSFSIPESHLAPCQLRSRLAGGPDVHTNQPMNSLRRSCSSGDG